MNGIIEAPPPITGTASPARDPRRARPSTQAIKSEHIKKEEVEEQAQLQEEEVEEADPEQMIQPPRELSSFEKHQVFQEILHRFFESEYRFSGAPTGTFGVGKDEKYEKDTLAAAKYGWMLLITRLLTRGRVKEATTQLETVLQAKESLVSHILDDFKER
jgi:hypothetical protein